MLCYANSSSSLNPGLIVTELRQHNHHRSNGQLRSLARKDPPIRYQTGTCMYEYQAFKPCEDERYGLCSSEAATWQGSMAQQGWIRPCGWTGPYEPHELDLKPTALPPGYRAPPPPEQLQSFHHQELEAGISPVGGDRLRGSRWCWAAARRQLIKPPLRRMISRRLVFLSLSLS